MRTDRRIRSEHLLLMMCFVGVVLSFVAWVVNAWITVATYSGSPTENVVCRIVAIDETTASTGMLVLTFGLPLVVWWMKGRRAEAAPTSWLRYGFRPAFYKFLLYLGLAGTLWGMIVGLWAVGGNEDKSQQLTRLITGTATGLVSSLMALVAAALAYVLQNAMLRVGWVERSTSTAFADLLRVGEAFRDLSSAARLLALATKELTGGMRVSLARVNDLAKAVTHLHGLLSERIQHVVEQLKTLLGKFSLSLEDAKSEILKGQAEQLAVQQDLARAMALLATTQQQLVAQQQRSNQLLALQLKQLDLLSRTNEEARVLLEREHTAAETERNAHRRAQEAYAASAMLAPPALAAPPPSPPSRVNGTRIAHATS